VSKRSLPPDGCCGTGLGVGTGGRGGRFVGNRLAIIPLRATARPFLIMGVVAHHDHPFPPSAHGDLFSYQRPPGGGPDAHRKIAGPARPRTN
jgi:hypothetical protein